MWYRSCPKNFCVAVPGDCRLEKFQKDQKVVPLKRPDAAASCGQSRVYIIPRQFPFAIEVPSSCSLEPEGLARLDERVKRLNSLNRAHIVRSIICKKIIEKNFRRQEAGSREPAKLTVQHRHLLTETVLSSSEFAFSFADLSDGSRVGNISADTKLAGSSPRNIELDVCCTLVSFKLEYKEQSKLAKTVLVMKKLRKPRLSDIYYCYSRFKNGIFIKLYVEPQRLESSEQRFAFVVTKIQVQLRSTNTRSTPLATANESFVSSILKSSANHISGNIRLNISSPLPEAPLLDSVSDGNAAEARRALASSDRGCGHIVFKRSLGRAASKAALPTALARHELIELANAEHSRLSSQLIQTPPHPVSLPQGLLGSEQQALALDQDSICGSYRKEAEAPPLSESRHTGRSGLSNSGPRLFEVTQRVVLATDERGASRAASDEASPWLGHGLHSLTRPRTDENEGEKRERDSSD